MVFVFLFCATTWAQVTPPPVTPKKDPFQGFGNALDQRPPGMRMAQTPPSISQLPGPAGHSGMTFEAKSVSNGGGVKTDRGVTLGANYEKLDSTQTQENKSQVEIVVRNLSTMAVQAHFDWFFVAREVQSRREFVWSQGQRDVPLTPGVEHTELLESTPLVETTRRKTEYTKPANSTALQQVQQQSSTEQSGARPFGWIVRLWDGKQLVQVQASSLDLEFVGRDPAQMGKLTGAPAGAPR